MSLCSSGRDGLCFGRVPGGTMCFSGGSFIVTGRHGGVFLDYLACYVYTFDSC